MNSRERVLSFGVLAVVLLAGSGFLFQQLFLGPLQDRNAAIAAMEDDLQDKENKVVQILAERPKLDLWKQISLPSDSYLARREYEKYLTDLLRNSGFEAGAFSVKLKTADTKSSPVITGKGPIYTKLTYTVVAHGPLANLVTALQRFYRTGLVHQIKDLAIQRPLTVSQQQSQEDLDIHLTVEALILNGAGKRNFLLPGIDQRLLAVSTVAALAGGPAGLALVPHLAGPSGPLGPAFLARTDKDYATITRKNIFFGAAQTETAKKDEPEVTKFVYLTDITRNDRRTEGFLYDRYNNHKTRLRAEPGFDTFRITDGSGDTKVRGKVLRIDERDVYFRVDTHYYAIHVGQNLEESMKDTLTKDRLRALGLVPAEPKVASDGGSGASSSIERTASSLAGKTARKQP